MIRSSELLENCTTHFFLVLSFSFWGGSFREMTLQPTAMGCPAEVVQTFRCLFWRRRGRGNMSVSAPNSFLTSRGPWRRWSNSFFEKLPGNHLSNGACIDRCGDCGPIKQSYKLQSKHLYLRKATPQSISRRKLKAITERNAKPCSNEDKPYLFCVPGRETKINRKFCQQGAARFWTDENVNDVHFFKTEIWSNTSSSAY